MLREIKRPERMTAERPPKVSVILPSYNHAPYVLEAVESVLSQSFEDLELIVIDDGSTDGSAAKLRSVADPRFYLEVLKTNHGYSSVLNASIARARGELVALFCSDDAFLPGKLQRQVTFLDDNPHVAAVFGKPMFVDAEGRPCPPRSHPFDGAFIDDLPDRLAWLRFFFLHGNALCHPTALVRRAVFDQVGEYDPLLVQLQDYDFWVRLSSRHELRVLDEPLISYRVREGQNVSWPTAETARRTAWETRRVLRRFLGFDTELIMQVFSADFAELGVRPDLSPKAALGVLLAMRAAHPARQAVALEFLEEAAAEGDAGVDHRMFHQLTGELDPFGLGSRESERQAMERLQAAEHHVAAAEAQVNELEQRLAAAEVRASVVETQRIELEGRLAVVEGRAATAEARGRELEQRAAAAEARAASAEARGNELRQRAAVAEAFAQAVTSSTTWRLTSPLRRFVESRPTVRMALRRGISLICRTNAAEAGSVASMGHSVDAPPVMQTPTASDDPSVPPAAEPAAGPQLRPEWEYVPGGLPLNNAPATGWEHPSVIETQQRKWPAFVQAVRSTNPLGVYHEAADIESENPAAHNFVLAFAYVLARAAVGRRSLSVLDWGGGLGHYAVIARAVMPEVSVDYTVFDLPALCAAGQEVLPDVHFTSNAEACLSRRYDLIFASGSLQYAADWQNLLRRFATSSQDWVFLSTLR